MSSLPRFSPKRLKEIADGTRNRDGSKKMTTEEYRAKVAKPTKKMTKAKAKAYADKWFSQWIRLRDSDEEGFIVCVTSGKRMHWKDSDCGHYISRAKLATRYDERNAHAQGGMANRFQGGHFLEHGLAIERIHGAGTRSALEQKAMMECRMTVNDFVFIGDTYKKRVEWIKQHEPVKFQRAA